MHAVVRSCFGMKQFPRYPGDIRALATSFFKLKDHCDQISILKRLQKPIHVSVTTKVHDIFIHVKQCLDVQRDTNGLEFGLGHYSEQP